MNAVSVKPQEFFLAIDPLALLLPSSVYPKVVEGLHPHVDLVTVLTKVAKTMPAEEREEAARRAAHVQEVAGAVCEAMK